MKKAVLCFFIFLCVITHISAQIKSRVDERFELTGIVFRLAGAREYVNNDVKLYANDIDTYFEKFKNHALIKNIEKIREEYGIGYACVSGLAVVLEIKNSKIQLIKDADIHKDDKIKSKKVNR
jgi:hypothetical protein